MALTDDPRELLATRAWELVHVLGHGDAHRSVVTRALDDSAPHRTEALLALDPLAAGAHSIHAVYSGDAENTPATTSSVDVNVRTTAGASVSVDDSTPVLGDEITLTATVTGNAPTGTVEFFDGATSLGSSVLDAGTASISTSRPG